MKNCTIFFTIVFLGFCFSVSVFGQANLPEGPNTQFSIPQNIHSLQQQIKIAEQNEDWEEYYSLRPKLISAWQEVDPNIAALYRSTNSPESDQLKPDAPKPGEQNTEVLAPFWGDDEIVHTGNVIDISLINTRGDTLYLAALNSTGSAVNIYRSADGGNNWSTFMPNFSLTNANKIELLDFDGYTGSNGPSYILLFSQYSSGVLYCTRFETTTGNYVNSIVVSTGCTDFSVDRSYPNSNYRCFVQYDSASTQYHKRSDPASYATIWQDPVNISSCKDPDLAYGLNGSLYLVYIGRSSGNLYLNSNYTYGDPTTFFNQRTIEFGATDTTFTPEIIASRHDTSAQTVLTVYNWLNNGRSDLRTAKKVGGGGWSSPANWSSFSSTDNKLVHLYCRKVSNNGVFQASFTRTGLSNALPRAIRYRKFDSGSWNSSIQVSDTLNSVTGVQASMVTQLTSGIAVFAYAGSSGVNVYFDREDWVTDVTSEIQVVEDYSLEQNYPNPFNPSTKIRWQSPVSSHQTLKIYDVLGNEVATLVDEYREAGRYELEFNASNLSSGVYIYKLQAGDYVSSKKMILIK